MLVSFPICSSVIVKGIFLRRFNAIVKFLSAKFNNLSFKATFNSFWPCTNELFFPLRCHQEVVAAVFLRVWIFYPLQHHLRACSRSHRCPSLELSCRLLDSSQLEYKPIPAPQPPTLLCLLSLPGGFLSTRALCSACVRGSWELQRAHEELEPVHRHPSFPVPRWGKPPEKLDANNLLTPLLAAFLPPLPPTHSTSWGHAYPSEDYLYPHSFLGVSFWSNPN